VGWSAQRRHRVLTLQAMVEHGERRLRALIASGKGQDRPIFPSCN